MNTIIDPRHSELVASRHEDLRLVTGQGKYTADWHLPGQLHACMVRSDRAHARLVSVDVAGAILTPPMSRSLKVWPATCAAAPAM